MAPELIKGDKKYTEKVDIWSFGIFAMEMADGDPPYIDEQQSHIIFNIVKKDPPQINERWSNEFREFVKKCLTKNPDKRPSAEELLKHPFLKDAEKYEDEFKKMVLQYKELKKVQNS